MRHLVRVSLVLASVGIVVAGLAGALWQHHRQGTVFLVGPVPAVVTSVSNYGSAEYKYRDRSGAEHTDSSSLITPTPSPGATIPVVYFANNPGLSLAGTDTVNDHVEDVTFDLRVIVLGSAAAGLSLAGLALGLYAGRRRTAAGPMAPPSPRDRAR